MSRYLCAAALLALALANPAAAAGPLRADSNLILVNATVLDKTDHFVTGLSKDNFRLYDQGVEQEISSVSVEDIPISLGIVFDASRSMTPVIPMARQAMRALLGAANPNDEYFIVQVRSRPRISLDFVTRPDEVLASLGAIEPGGRTTLLDAVYLAADHLKRARNPRKALLVITDGKDNNSRYSQRELLRFLSESGATLYAVGLNIHTPTPEGGIPDEADLLDLLARQTGGRYFECQTAADLPAVARKLDIRYQYVLGYRPPALKLDGRYHSVKLRLAHAGGMRAYWRPGYYATPAGRD